VELRQSIRSAFSSSHVLVRIVYRDPEHVSERLTLLGVRKLAGPSREWAQSMRQSHPDAQLTELAEKLRVQSAQIARTDGAIAGTPFYAALVPGYLNYLWQEMRMTLRLAALYGRDPGAIHTSAELLSLRGVHPTVEAAEAELRAIGDRDLPASPAQRRPLRVWIDSVRRLLVFGGFVSPPKHRSRRGAARWLRDGAALLLGAVGWVVTWIFPVTFMVMMAWTCENHTRRLFRDAVMLYSGARPKRAIDAARERKERGVSLRNAVSAVALGLSIAIPIVFLVYVVHRNALGLNGLTGAGALTAISLMLTTVVLGYRR
jgi:hypothetical protein